MSQEQFHRGIDEFNRGCFFECHDTLEDLWHGTRGRDRLFLQGLIQVAVGFYHLTNRNFKGAASQFMRGLAKLDGYRPVHRNLDLDALTTEVVRWLLLAERGRRGEQVEIDRSTIPTIHFTDVVTSKES